MQKIKVLILADHRNHSSENSLYALAKEMRKHSRCAQLDVASRGIALNQMFFEKHIAKGLFVSKVEEGFAFFPDGRAFKKNLRREPLRSYHAIWLRLPPPLSTDFLGFLQKKFPNQLIFNNPKGILECGSKAFLTNFRELCPPLKICRSLHDIITFKNRFPIVLKPFSAYGGKGLVRIEGTQVWEANQTLTFAKWSKGLEDQKIEFMAVKFLPKVTEGDKRIVVVNGVIIGASLRLPASNSWLCNVSQGGQSTTTQVTEEERKIIYKINPVLSNQGIVMYGVDTLMGDNGQRVLSEINTTSIGGVVQIAEMEKKPLVRQTTDLIWEFILEKL